MKTLNRQRPYLSAKPALSRAKRVGLAVVACGLAALALSAGVGASSSFRSGSVTAAAAAAMRDPASVFARRSPGHRGLGALLQTKMPAFAKTAIERVVSGRVPRAPVDAPESQSPAVGDETPPAALVEAPEAFDFDTGALDLPIVETLSPPIEIGGGGGGGIVNLGPNPHGGGPGGVITETPETLDSPVPEPETWAVMIIGFFGIGLALRTRARRERRLVA